MKKDYGKIKKGFKTLLPHLEGRGKYIANCKSCAYYYEPSVDSPEQCNNKGITEFDMVEDGDRIYCTYWTSCGMLTKRRKDNG